MTRREVSYVVVILMCVGIMLGQRSALDILGRQNAMLAADYQDALVADNRTTRSRTGFQFPRMGAVEMQAITEVAQALSWPWELHAAGEKTENGGMHLELGVQRIPGDIRKNFPPYMWQRAAAVRIMQEEAGRMIIDDPEVTYVFAARLARRWKSIDPKTWCDNFITNLNKYRGEGGTVRPSKPVNLKKAGKRKKK